jgi:hypothetical protein
MPKTIGNYHEIDEGISEKQMKVINRAIDSVNQELAFREELCSRFENSYSHFGNGHPRFYRVPGGKLVSW